MAEQEIVLKLTPSESHALAHLLFVLYNEQNRATLSRVFGTNFRTRDEIEIIGRINAAINSYK